MFLLLLFPLGACSTDRGTEVKQPEGTQSSALSIPEQEILASTQTPTENINEIPTQEVILHPPAGIVFLTDEGQFVTQAEGPPKLIFKAQVSTTWENFSPDQNYILEFAAFDQVLVNLQDNSQVHIWPREDLNLCPFNWAPGQPAVLISVLLPQGDDPGFSCNRGSPVLLSAASLELTILDESGSGLSGPSVSPDGQTLAYDIDGIPWLFRFTEPPTKLDLNRFGVNRLQAAKFADPSWSSSGRYLAWTFRVSTDNSLQGVAILDFSENAVMLFTPFDVSSHENFRPRIYFNQTENYLVLDQYLSEQGDFASLVFSLQDGSFRKLDGYFSSWSPVGDLLVYERKPGDFQCRMSVESPDGSISIPICQGDQVRWNPDGSLILSYPYNRDQFWLTDLRTQITVRIDLPSGADILSWETDT